MVEESGMALSASAVPTIATHGGFPAPFRAAPGAPGLARPTCQRTHVPGHVAPHWDPAPDRRLHGLPACRSAAADPPARLRRSRRAPGGEELRQHLPEPHA